VRDIEEIDSELGLLLAIRNMTRKAEGRTPNTARIDTLLDERSAATFSGNTPVLTSPPTWRQGPAKAWRSCG